MAKAFFGEHLIAESAAAPILSETGVDGDRYDTLREAKIVASDSVLQEWIEAGDWWGQVKPTPDTLRAEITHYQATTLPDLEWDEEWHSDEVGDAR